MNATATFETQQANRHMTALCDHFSRKVPVERAPNSGRVAFPFGACELTADTTCLQLSASATDATKLEQVVEEVTHHLERFAYRERPHLTWHFPDT